MIRFAILVSMVLWAMMPAAAEKTDSIATPQSVGLVLSGGGAKGIAHIGVIQALEDNNIPIDYITGTSMGAIVGSLYACGYTPQQMMDIITSEEFQHWSTGEIDRRLSYYFLQDDPTPSALTLNLGDSDSTRWKSVLPTSLISTLPMNYGFLELFAPYTAQCGGDFNRLFVPFRCVSSDMTHKRMVVNAEGSLGDAVRASMSFPLVFHPIRRDGALMYDGGIFDNFPVDVMRSDFAPQIMIGVDVAAGPDESDESTSMLSQLETMIMQHSDYELPSDEGIKMRIHLEKFGLLDFQKADAIYKIGYDKAVEMMDSIRGRVHSRIPADARALRRDVFKAHTPYMRFDSVNVVGGTESQNAYVKALFTRHSADTFGIDRLRDSYYRAITPGKFKNLEPTAVYNDSTGLFRLDLDATVKDNLFLSVGGYLTTSTNSMLFLSAGYKTLSFHSLDVRLKSWIGQSYLGAELSGQIRLSHRVPTALRVRGVAARQKYFRNDKMFFQTSQPTFVTNEEFYGMAEYGVACGRNGKLWAGGGFGREQSNYYGSAIGFVDAKPSRLTQNQWLLRADYEYNTLSSAAMPVSGTFFHASAIGMSGRSKGRYATGDESAMGGFSTRSTWGQIDATVDHYISMSDHFSLGFNGEALASTRSLLPGYSSSIVNAPAWTPTASYGNVFASEFRANSFGVAGIEPVWRINGMLQVRAAADIFVPLRPILAGDDGNAHYGKCLSKAYFFTQLEANITLPIGTVKVYTHYADVREGRWNFGLSFGTLLRAPRFTR